MAGKLSIAIALCAALVAVVAMRAAPGASQQSGEVLPRVVDVPVASPMHVAPVPRVARVSRPLPTMRPPIDASPTQLRDAFERTGDLFTLLQTLESAAQRGNAEARWLASRVHEYCAPVARSPVGYARDTALIDSLGLRAAAPLGDARSRVGDRCARFVPGDVLTFVQLVEAREDAALAGSLAAEAALLAMGEPLDDDEAYRADLVDRVQASRDPEAYLALAPAMGIAASGDDALAGRIAGTQGAEQAWQIAGCRLGQACGPDSALMTQYCANGGICAQDRRQDFEAFVREAAMPQERMDEVEVMVDALVRGEAQLVGVVSR